MARTVGIGIQNFEKIIETQCFYVDKTDFIREWWESKDEVTLITRPRRCGKTLNMSMLEYFFLSNMQIAENCLKGFPSGSMRNIRGFRGPIRLSACPLPE